MGKYRERNKNNKKRQKKVSRFNHKQLLREIENSPALRIKKNTKKKKSDAKFTNIVRENFLEQLQTSLFPDAPKPSVSKKRARVKCLKSKRIRHMAKALDKTLFAHRGKMV